jgi:hypothetical protein
LSSRTLYESTANLKYRQLKILLQLLAFSGSA